MRRSSSYAHSNTYSHSDSHPNAHSLSFSFIESFGHSYPCPTYSLGSVPRIVDLRFLGL